MKKTQGLLAPGKLVFYFFFLLCGCTKTPFYFCIH
uniref:Lipoprotein n=1 Tax=Rhizophora mucronata TaxID=61149 RepID=A0A2P2MZL3_RHIMU